MASYGKAQKVATKWLRSVRLFEFDSIPFICHFNHLREQKAVEFRTVELGSSASILGLI